MDQVCSAAFCPQDVSTPDQLTAQVTFFAKLISANELAGRA